MAARLILVTTNYPFAYTGGEVMFVAPEVSRLVQEFGTVRIVPLHAEGERLDVPEGVQVDLGLSRALRRERRGAYLRALAWPGFWGEMWRAVRCGGWVGCARVWRWAAAAQVTYRWARAACVGADAVLFYTYWRSGSTLALARLARERPRTAVVTRVHGHDLYEHRFHPPFQPWHPALYRELTLTIAISQHGFDYLRDAGVRPRRLLLARLGTEPPVDAARPSTDGAIRVVSCSSVDRNKRVAHIARALAELAARHPAMSIRWTHFGAGPELGRVRDSLRSAPTNLQADLPGQVAQRAVMAHYAREPVDVFVLLSLSEGLPMSIQEAASAGIPIVATDVGGVRELVGGDNGALLSADPPIQEVVAAIERLVLSDDASARETRRTASRQRWAEGFDAERNHRGLARCLRTLLGTL